MNIKKARSTLALAGLYSTLILFLFLCGLAAFIALFKGISIPFTIFSLLPLLFSIVVFIFSEAIIVKVMKCERIENISAYQDFVQVTDECMKGRWMLQRPRLYVAHEPKVPNAFAFGWGVFGQYAIAVTPEMHKMMNRDQLKAIVGHELAHIIFFDVVMMTLISIMRFGINYLKKIIFKSFGGVGWIVWVFGWLTEKSLNLFAMLYSQEREIAADTKSALITNNPDSMASALSKLQDYVREKSKSQEKKPKTIVDDLMISHPKMEERIGSLQKMY